MQYRLQYCNEVHYVNSGYSWGGTPPPQLETWGGELPPPPASYAYVALSKQAKHTKLHSFYQNFKG